MALHKVALLVLSGVLISFSGATAETPSSFPSNSFAVYAMARVSGVSEPTRQARQQVLDLLEEAKERGDVLKLVQIQVGHEGATRLCATFVNTATASAAWEQVRQLVEDVELMSLKAEACNK